MSEEQQAQEWFVKVFGSLKEAAENIEDWHANGLVYVKSCEPCSGLGVVTRFGRQVYCGPCEGTGKGKLPELPWAARRASVAGEGGEAS